MEKTMCCYRICQRYDRKSLDKEAIQCSGKIYSEEHRRKFDIKNDVFRVEKHPMDSGKLILTINRIRMGEWFKEQFDKLRQSLRRPTEEPRKSRGFKL